MKRSLALVIFFIGSLVSAEWNPEWESGLVAPKEQAFYENLSEEDLGRWLNQAEEESYLRKMMGRLYYWATGQGEYRSTKEKIERFCFFCEGKMLSVRPDATLYKDQAVDCFIQAAELGHAVSLNYLGDIYSSTDSSDYFVNLFLYKDFDSAFNCYTLSANQGYAPAQYSLGQMYRYWYGGLPEHYFEALKWYKLAANQGYALAQCALGKIYYDGLSPYSRDRLEAVKWYKLAAEQGNHMAQWDLGVIYFWGLQNIPQNRAEGLRLMDRSTEGGDAILCRYLARMYERGEYINRDISEAVRLYKVASEKGNFEARGALRRLLPR